MSRKLKSWTTLVGIIALTSVTRLDSIMAPSLVKIQQSFPQADPTQVESIASIGDVASMIASFIFGFILTRITYKQAAVLGLSLLAAGGLLPLWIHQNVSQLIIFALIVGLGSGAITTVLPSLSAAAYQGERRSDQFGFNVALEDGFAMVWIVIGGYLANISWLHNYYVYTITIVALILAILFVPNIHSTDNEVTNNKMNVSQKNQWGLIIALVIISMLVEVLVAVMTNKMALYLHYYHIGGPSTSGKALLFVRAASIVAGIEISVYRKTFGHYLLAAGFGSIILGAVILIYVHTFWTSALAAFLIGTGGSIALITIPFLLSNLASAKVYPIVMGTFSALTSLGFAFSAWFFKYTAPIFSNNNLIGTFWAMITLSVIIILVLLFSQIQKKASV